MRENKQKPHAKAYFLHFLLKHRPTLKYFTILYFSICTSAMECFSFGVERYDWEIVTSNKTYSTRDRDFMQLNTHEILLDACIIKIRSKSSVSQTPSQKDSDDNSFQGRKFLHKVTEIYIEDIPSEKSFVDQTLISSLKNFVHLEKLTIKSSYKSNGISAKSISGISNCRDLNTLVLDIENIPILNGNIILTLPNLETFTFHNRQFTGQIILNEAYSMYTIEIRIDSFKGFNLYYSGGIPDQQVVHATVHTNQIEEIPLVALTNPSFFLEIFSLNENHFSIPEHTRVTKNRIKAGASGYTNKIISEKIRQNNQPLFSCDGSRIISWKAFYKHLESKHKTKNILLSTYKKEQNKNTLTLPGLSNKEAHTYNLTLKNIEEIVLFLSQMKISKLCIKIGKVEFLLRDTEKYSHCIDDWDYILSSLSELSISSTNGSVTVPVCFYKLYTLTSLTVTNSHLPNLLSVLVSMPGLKHVNVSDCTFDHANSLSICLFMKYATGFGNSKFIELKNNSSENDIFTMHHGTMLFFAMGTIILIFVFVTFKSKKSTNNQILK